jgi:hypothetical protein
VGPPHWFAAIVCHPNRRNGLYAHWHPCPHRRTRASSLSCPDQREPDCIWCGCLLQPQYRRQSFGYGDSFCRSQTFPARCRRDNFHLGALRALFRGVAEHSGRWEAQKVPSAGSGRRGAAPAAWEAAEPLAEEQRQDLWSRDPAPRRAVITPRQTPIGI